MNLQEKLALACRILAMQGHNDYDLWSRLGANGHSRTILDQRLRDRS
jgi:hypothetical protein